MVAFILCVFALFPSTEHRNREGKKEKGARTRFFGQVPSFREAQIGVVQRDGEVMICCSLVFHVFVDYCWVGGFWKGMGRDCRDYRESGGFATCYKLLDCGCGGVVGDHGRVVRAGRRSVCFVWVIGDVDYSGSRHGVDRLGRVEGDKGRQVERGCVGCCWCEEEGVACKFFRRVGDGAFPIITFIV